MATYLSNHPDDDDEMVNRVEAFDPPHGISWKPGSDADDGNLAFSGWIWRALAISSPESVVLRFVGIGSLEPLADLLARSDATGSSDGEESSIWMSDSTGACSP